MTAAAVLAVLVLLAAAAAYLASTRRREAAPKPAEAAKGGAAPVPVPGMEPSDPDLGNLGDVGAAGSLHQFLQKLHGSYGPVAAFYWQKQRVVSVASPAAFKAITRLFDRPKSLFALFEPMIGAGSIQYANGAEGKARRREYVDPAFTHRAVRGLYWAFEKVARDLVASWDGRASVKLHAEMMMAALNSISSTALGAALGADELRAVNDAYTQAWHEMEDRVAGSFPEAGGERQRRFDESIATLHRTTARLAAERRAARAAGTVGEELSFIDHLLDADSVKDEETRANEVITMMVGGSHTTGNSLTWALYYVARHPEVQRRLVDELREVLPAGRDVPTFDDVAKLPYLGQVLNETLRCSVLAPWAARESERDTEICGHLVPAGTPILTALGVVLKDANLWTEPDKFDPDRFGEARRREVPPIAFSPFGFAGKRVCPGVRYAQFESAAILGAVLLRFRVALPKDMREPQPVYGLVTSPSEEIQLLLEPRA